MSKDPDTQEIIQELSLMNKRDLKHTENILGEVDKFREDLESSPDGNIYANLQNGK